MAKNFLKPLLIDEVFMTLSVFTKKETFLGYVKLSITRDLFKNEDEYNEFYRLLDNFHQLMMRGNETYTTSLLRDLQDSFNALANRFPEQTDRLILETIYDARQSSRVPNALSYITKKNVVSTKFTALNGGSEGKTIYTMGMLSSSTISQYLDDGKLSKSEQYFCDTFLSTEKGLNMLRVLSADDISRCVRDTRMMPAAYFSISNIFENVKDENKRLELVSQYLYGDIRNFNLDRFKLIMFYRYFKEMYKANGFNTSNIDVLEAIRNECALAVPSAPLSLEEVKISIPVLEGTNAFEINLVSALTGRVLPMDSISRGDRELEPEQAIKNNALSIDKMQSDFSKIGLSDDGIHHKIIGSSFVQNMVQDFPMFIVSNDSEYVTKEVLLSDGGVILKRTLLKEIDDLLLALKFDQIIKIYEDDIQKRAGNKTPTDIDIQKQQNYKYTSIKELLKGVSLNKDSLELFSARLLEKVRFENLECDSQETEEIFKTEKLNIITYLVNEKIFSLSIAMDFDFEALCTCIQNNTIQITAEDLMKTRLLQSQKEVFINMSITNESLLQALLNSNNITRLDIFNLKLDSYLELVPILFNRNILSIDDLVLLMKQGKITLNDINSFELENVHISDSEIILKYSNIYRKRIEYEEAVKANYENTIQQGIKEADIKESDEERRLREELQELTYFKDVYIALFKKQKMSSIEEYHRRQDIYMAVMDACYNDNDFVKSIASISNMLYQDNFISMAQVQNIDNGLVIPILKSGMAKKEDIDKFKSEIVSLDEIEKMRKKLSEDYSDEKLEEELRKQIYILTYEKLDELMNQIISDSNSTKEEKLSILYSIFSRNTITENDHRDFFERMILVKIYSKLKNTHPKLKIDPDDERPPTKEKKDLDDIDTSNPRNQYRKFVYPTNIIWSFMKLLDSDVKFKILSDGYVVFESERLNKVFIENVWHSVSEDFVRRGYGAATLVLDLDVFKLHELDIIKKGRYGYKLDVWSAKSYLPMVATSKGLKPKGMIVHEKDLKNTRKKEIWFELILEHLGITQKAIDSKKTSYTQEEYDEINKFISDARFKYDEILM